MDQKGDEKDYMEEEIEGLIKTNQTLLRKKGLLKRLLDDNMIKKLLKSAGKLKKEDGKENLLDKREKKLLEILEQNNFDLDETIEKIVKNTADKMAEDLQKKVKVTGEEVMSKDERRIGEKKGMKFVIFEGEDGEKDTRLMVASEVSEEELRRKGARTDDDASLKSDETSIKTGEEYTIQTKARIRERPEKDSKVVGDLLKDTIVTALGVETLDDEKKTERVLVKTKKGDVQGWVSLVTDKGETLKKTQGPATAGGG